MLRTVLWIAAACAAVLLALAVSRWMSFDAPPKPPAPALEPTAPVAAEPVAPAAPEPAPVAPLTPTPDEVQIQDDAAATGMTTMEPEEPAPPTN